MPVSAPTAARPASSTGVGRLGGDVAADLGLVPRMRGGGVDDRETLPRAGGTVDVYTGDRRSRRPPRLGEAHLVDSDRPKSPASSVHQWVRRRPAAASSAATPSGRNLLGHLGEHLLAGGEVDRQVQVRRRAHAAEVPARSHISMRSSSAFHGRRARTPSRSKSASSSRFTTASTFLLNSAVTPAASS